MNGLGKSHEHETFEKEKKQRMVADTGSSWTYLLGAVVGIALGRKNNQVMCVEQIPSNEISQRFEAWMPNWNSSWTEIKTVKKKREKTRTNATGGEGPNFWLRRLGKRNNYYNSEWGINAIQTVVSYRKSLNKRISSNSSNYFLKTGSNGN